MIVLCKSEKEHVTESVKMERTGIANEWRCPKCKACVVIIGC